MGMVANTAGKIPKLLRQRWRDSFVRFAAGRLRSLIAPILLALTAVGCASTHLSSGGKMQADYVKPDFEERRTNLVRVAVMPPRVDILRLRFWRERKGSAREVAATSQKLQRAIAAQLKSNGFTVQPASTNGSADPAAARQRLDEWMSGLTWAEPQQDLGETAKVLADDAQADALVCVQFVRTRTTWQRRLRGYHTTAASWVGAAAGAGGVLAGLYFSHAEGISGEGAAGLTIIGGVAGFFLFKETSWLITGGGDPDDEPLPNRAVLQIALVDGKSGEVLWSNSVTVESGSKDVDRMVADVFLNFPK